MRRLCREYVRKKVKHTRGVKTRLEPADPIENQYLSSGRFKKTGSYVVSLDIYWFETIYGKCLHKRTNQRSRNYMRRGGHQ